MNAKDISSKRFEKSAFGYRPDEVDSYLRELSSEVMRLQKDKDDCEKKIEVLADKIREYMQDEEALKEALLGAQRQGHQVLEESKMTAKRILSEANEKAEEIVGQTKYQLQREKEALAIVKKEVSDFKTRLFSLYKSHFEILQEIPDYDSEDYAQQQKPVSKANDIQQPETEPELRVQESTQEQHTTEQVHAAGGSSPFIKSSASNENKRSDLRFGNNNK